MYYTHNIIYDEYSDVYSANIVNQYYSINGGEFNELNVIEPLHSVQEPVNRYVSGEMNPNQVCIPIEQSYFNNGTMSLVIKVVDANGNSDSILFTIKGVTLPDITYVDYIKSTGTQYIDTGLKCDYGCSYEFKFIDEGYTGTPWRAYFGVDTLDANNSFRVVRKSADRLNIAYGGTQTSYSFDQPDKYNISTFYSTGERFGINNEFIRSFDKYSNTTKFTESLLIFMSRHKGNYDVTGVFRFYGMKIWDRDENLIADYRPCLDSSGVPCIYDEVSMRCLYNSGTGTFEYGYGLPEMNEPA